MSQGLEPIHALDVVLFLGSAPDAALAEPRKSRGAVTHSPWVDDKGREHPGGCSRREVGDSLFANRGPIHDCRRGAGEMESTPW